MIVNNNLGLNVDIDYINDKRLDKIREHTKEIITKGIAPSKEREVFRLSAGISFKS